MERFFIFFFFLQFLSRTSFLFAKRNLCSRVRMLSYHYCRSPLSFGPNTCVMQVEVVPFLRRSTVCPSQSHVVTGAKSLVIRREGWQHVLGITCTHLPVPGAAKACPSRRGLPKRRRESWWWLWSLGRCQSVTEAERFALGSTGNPRSSLTRRQGNGTTNLPLATHRLLVRGWASTTYCMREREGWNLPPAFQASIRFCDCRSLNQQSRRSGR